MKAIILTAGEGKRMMRLTSNCPKSMLPVTNKPILEYIITEVRKTGITDFGIVVGYKSNKLTEYFGNGDKRGVCILYRLQQQTIGTADALSNSK